MDGYLVPNIGSIQQRDRIPLTVIFGPMFSGKTTELIRRLKRYQVANHKCLIVKYANDLRYKSTGLATHDQQTLAAVATIELLPLMKQASEFSVIGIDEGQFFPDTVKFCETMANSGKIVIVAALDGTYQRQPFGDILGLVPLAENVIKLTAVCMLCYKEASYTKRKGCETEVEVIGGADKYMAVCRSCYTEQNACEMQGAADSKQSHNICDDIFKAKTHSPDFHCC